MKAAFLRGGIPYALGKGGMKPEAGVPWTLDGLDCTGFCAWALGLSRKESRIPGGWIESTMIVRDAKSAGGIFSATGDPRPSDLAVWGDRGNGQGHAGVIVEVGGGLPVSVVHCSKGNWNARGNALLETAATLFLRNGAIYVRCDLIEEIVEGSPA